MTAWSRRGFLQGMLVGGGALALAACGGGGQRACGSSTPTTTGELLANLYITVLATAASSLIVNKAEIGQGVTTGYATLVAEELDVPVDHIDVHYADSHEDMRDELDDADHRRLDEHGAEASCRCGTPRRRRARCWSRAAAQQWSVPANDCTPRTATSSTATRALAYGELTKARRAARASRRSRS